MLLPKSHSSQLRAVFFVLETHKIAQASPSRCLMPDFAMVVAKTSMTLQRQVLKKTYGCTCHPAKKRRFYPSKIVVYCGFYELKKKCRDLMFFLSQVSRGSLKCSLRPIQFVASSKTSGCDLCLIVSRCPTFPFWGLWFIQSAKTWSFNETGDLPNMGGFDTHFLMEVWFLGANSLNISSSFISLCISIDWCLRIQDCSCDWIPVDLHIYNIIIYIIYT